LIKAYLNIERARFEERLRVTIEMPAVLANLRIPSLLIQPLVENAIKHGIAPCKDGGEVVVIAKLEETVPGQAKSAEMLHISVRDTGAGMTDKKVGRGVGLANVERRLKCHYGDEAALKITSAAGVGTEVEVSLPIRIDTIDTNGTLSEIISSEDGEKWPQNYAL
jgi:two-component system, LytTR family, sensor kinase